MERPRGRPGLRNGKKYALAALGLMYLIAWIWGIPAVHTNIANETVGYY